MVPDQGAGAVAMSVDVPEGDVQGLYLSAIRRTGDSLHLIDSAGHETICLPSGPSRWIPTDSDSYTLTTSIPDPADVTPTDPAAPNDPDNPSDGSVTAKLIAWHKKRLGKFHYSQSGNRLNPDKSGTTDCSGLQYACYKSVMGISVGTNSRDQANVAHHGRMVTTTRSEILHGTGMQRGDLIFYAHPGANWSHVEMYMGGSKVIGISNVHQNGSRIQALSLQVNYFRGKLKVKRYA